MFFAFVFLIIYCLFLFSYLFQYDFFFLIDQNFISHYCFFTFSSLYFYYFFYLPFDIECKNVTPQIIYYLFFAEKKLCYQFLLEKGNEQKRIHCKYLRAYVTSLLKRIEFNTYYGIFFRILHNYACISLH